MYRIVLRVAAALSACGVAVAPALADDNDTCRYGIGDAKIAACSRVIQQNPKNASAFNSRGFAYNGKGDYDRAIADLDQAIRIDPKFAVAYNNRGVAYHGKGQYDRAIVDLDQAIRLDPKYAIAYNSRG